MRHGQCARSTFRGILPLAVLAAALGTGCAVNLMGLPYFLFAGESKLPPKWELLKDKRDTARILVLSYADPSMRFGYDAVDAELSNALVTEIAGAEPRFEVVPPHEVLEWRERHPDLADMDLVQIGEEFDVDYVLFIDLLDFDLNTTKNHMLLQGRTRVRVHVTEVDRGMQIHDDEYARQYPPDAPIPLGRVSTEAVFQRRFLQRMAKEISWYIVPHPPADDFVDY